MTDVELGQMEYLWHKGFPVSDIAKLMGYSPSTIYQVAGKYRSRFPSRNTWKARRSRDSAMVETALGMFADGMTGKEVAEALGISCAMAYRIRQGFT